MNAAKSMVAVVICVTASFAAAAAAPLRVDISPDNGRKGALSPDRENWLIKDAPTLSATFGGVTVTFRAVGEPGAGLSGGYWKGAEDYGVHMAHDGVMIKGGKGRRLEMVLSGLTPGRHRVTTYHSGVDTADMSPLGVTVDGEAKVLQINPSKRVTDDYDAAFATFEV